MFPKEIRWNSSKAGWLLEFRGIAMMKVAEEINAGRFTIKANARGQMVFEISLENYPVDAPAVVSDDHIFLKTAYRNRKKKAKPGRPHETDQGTNQGV